MSQTYTRQYAIQLKSGQKVEILTCDLCGALVAEVTRRKHDEWHDDATDPRQENIDRILSKAGVDKEMLRKLGLDRYAR